jgi:hypothetical protein
VHLLPDWYIRRALLWSRRQVFILISLSYFGHVCVVTVCKGARHPFSTSSSSTQMPILRLHHFCLLTRGHQKNRGSRTSAVKLPWNLGWFLRTGLRFHQIETRGTKDLVVPVPNQLLRFGTNSVLVEKLTSRREKEPGPVLCQSKSAYGFLLVDCWDSSQIGPPN